MLNTGTFQLLEDKQYKKPKNKSRTNVISHQVFIDSQKHIIDEYWINFFTDLAYNKFPKGFKYIEGCLCYRKPGKIYKTKIDNYPDVAAKQIIEFFHQYGDIYSPQEKISVESEERDDVTWKSLKAIEKKSYLNRYINKTSKKWNLNDDQSCQFNNTINNGISDGSIKSNRVIIKNKEIVEIEDVVFKSGKIEIKLTSKRNKSNKITNKTKTNLHIKKWVDILKKLETRRTSLQINSSGG
jgi:hypothetical protein